MYDRGRAARREVRHGRGSGSLRGRMSSRTPHTTDESDGPGRDEPAPGPASDPDALDRAAARHEVEAELDELGDPETAPGLPSTTLAAVGARADRAVARARPMRPDRPLVGELLRLGWPVMLGQVLVSVAGLVDRAMIGRLDAGMGSAVPLAAVGYATQFFSLIQSALFAVGLACVALMARAIGAGDPRRARDCLAASLQVAIGVTLVFTAVMLAAPETLLALLGARPEVIDSALVYLRLVVGSSVLLAITLTLDSALRADRNTRTPMIIGFAVTAVKLLLNWVLIFGTLGAPRLGLAGAGWATVASQLVGLAIYLVLMARLPATAPTAVRWRTLLRPHAVIGQVIRVAAPGVAERVVLNLGLLSYFWVLSSYYGTVAVAAYSVGVPLLSFSWIPGNGYAQACATLVGQRLGARDREGARRAGVQAALLAVGTAIPLAVLFGVLRFPLAELFTSDRVVIEALGPFMLALALGQPFLQLHFTLGGAHRGAGDTVTPLVAATVGNWLFRVPMACVCAIVLQADVVFVWYALIVDHLSRAVILGLSFRRGRWMTRLE